MTAKLLPFPGPVELALRALVNSAGPAASALVTVEADARATLEETPIYCVDCRRRITSPLDLVLVRKARQFRWCLFRCAECARTAD